METKTLTRNDFTERDGYLCYDSDFSFDGHVVIEGSLGWLKFARSVYAAGSLVIEAGSGIEAGEGIEAGSGIKAGWGIKAGSGIEAGWGIEAGFQIYAKWISSKLRIFAGLCIWRLPTAKEQKIRAELRDGVIAFGEHVPPSKSEEAA